MKKIVALAAATLALTATFALAGCGARDRLHNSGSTEQVGTGAGTGAQVGSTDPGAADTTLNDVEGLLRDVDSGLSDADAAPADSD